MRLSYLKIVIKTHTHTVLSWQEFDNDAVLYNGM